MHDPSERETPLIDLTEVTVDIDALDDFVKALRAELDQNLQPYSTQIIEDHLTGDPIGVWTASVPLQALRNRYGVCQGTAVDGLRSYVEATKVLLRAVEMVATYYRNTDGMAVARASDVTAALSAAQADVKAQVANDEAVRAAHTSRVKDSLA